MAGQSDALWLRTARHRLSGADTLAADIDSLVAEFEPVEELFRHGPMLSAICDSDAISFCSAQGYIGLSDDCIWSGARPATRFRPPRDVHAAFLARAT
jgi:hypothetical protein